MYAPIGYSSSSTNFCTHLSFPQRLAALEGGVKARDAELGRLSRQLDKSKSSEAEVAAKNSQV